jgi:hypothetical protein
MPLPLTNLDDRRWADLVDQGVAQIPVYAPSWTDQNIHDPGRTLIELFAWLTEMTTYRLNQVPARHRRKFLGLLGFHARPPRAAETVLSFSVDDNTLPFVLPAGTQFQTGEMGFETPKVTFATWLDVTLSAARLVSVQVDNGDGKLIDHSADLREGLAIKMFGANPQPGSAVYLGFKNLALQTPVALWFHLQGPGNNHEERERILEEADEQAKACRKVLPEIDCGEQPASSPEEPVSLPPHHSAVVAWEVFTGAVASPWLSLQGIPMPAHPAAGQVVDDTRSLTLDGLVELALPAGASPTKLGSVTDNLLYIRCRLAKGGFDVPPVLMSVRTNSVVARQSFPVFQTFTIARGAVVQGASPVPGQRIRFSLTLDGQGLIQSLQFLNGGSGPEVTVLKYQAPTNFAPGEITMEMAGLGFGTGRPLPVLILPVAPVEVRGLHLFTHGGGAWQEWTRREDLDSSQRTDFHFILNPTTGHLVFGDGERGRTPAPRDLIFVVYETTLAVLGNTPENQPILAADNLHNAAILAPLTAAQQTQINLVQQQALAQLTPAQRDQLRARIRRQAIRTGAAAESLEHVTGRAVVRLHAHEQLLDFAARQKSYTLDQLDPAAVRTLAAPENAVNVLDIERLALDVPGTRVSRAQACASLHPDYPCLDAPGFVRVVILPVMPVPEPQPTPGLLHAVKRFLDRRRMVCTRVEVVAPEYIEVRVSAAVKLETGASAARVISAVEQALNTFLDPLVGGPNGRGWPFGRSVYRTEIIQLIAGVHGVSYVFALSMSSGSGEKLCGDLPLCPSSLTTPGKHGIQVQK